jgi:hypothetical protein
VTSRQGFLVCRFLCGVLALFWLLATMVKNRSGKGGKGGNRITLLRKKDTAGALLIAGDVGNTVWRVTADSH